jgi:hypothetical protein
MAPVYWTHLNILQYQTDNNIKESPGLLVVFPTCLLLPVSVFHLVCKNSSVTVSVRLTELGFYRAKSYYIHHCFIPVLSLFDILQTDRFRGMIYK